MCRCFVLFFSVLLEYSQVELLEHPLCRVRVHVSISSIVLVRAARRAFLTFSVAGASRPVCSLIALFCFLFVYALCLTSNHILFSLVSCFLFECLRFRHSQKKRRCERPRHVAREGERRTMTMPREMLVRRGEFSSSSMFNNNFLSASTYN